MAIQIVVDPTLLTRVAFAGWEGAETAFVLKDHLEDGRPFLNSYARTGRIKSRRGHTIPISRASINGMKS